MIARLVVLRLLVAGGEEPFLPPRQAGTLRIGSRGGLEARQGAASSRPGEPSAVAVWRCCVASAGRASRSSSQAIRQIRTIPFRPSGRTVFDGLLRCCPLVRQIQGDRAREKTTPGYRMTIESPGREARRPRRCDRGGATGARLAGRRPGGNSPGAGPDRESSWLPQPVRRHDARSGRSG
jgi:hypothetical protein